MNVRIPDEFERYVRERIEQGDYPSASELISEALGLHREQSTYRNLRSKVTVGVNQALRGELVDGKATLDSLREELAAKYKAE